MTLGIIIIFMVIIIIMFFIILKSNIFNQDNNVVPIEIDEPETVEEPIPIVVEPPEKLDEIVSVDDMPKKMGSYDVIGKLVISKIGLDKYILDRLTDESLDFSVAKMEATDWDTAPINTVGNFCIGGHNYKKLFRRLKELNIGDEFYLVSADGRKVSYVIYDKFSVDPKDPNCEDCLKQDTNGKREVTLVTCNPGALTRLIIKAEEKN